METREYKTVDKSSWPRGEWDNEVDKIQYSDEITGLPCLILRNHAGCLCGYVGVPESHPLFGVDADSAGLEGHGGINFSDMCDPREEQEAQRICHVPGNGEPDHVWWFGFDCSHAGSDVLPALLNSMPNVSGLFGNRARYRNMEYVKGQNRDLALQLESRAHVE